MTKNLYKIKKDTGEVIEVEGKEVAIFDWLRAFIHRNIVKDSYVWVICELTTGLLISRGDTQKQAIANAQTLLNEKTKEVTLQKISDNQKLNKSCPQPAIDTPNRQTKMEIQPGLHEVEKGGNKITSLKMEG